MNIGSDILINRLYTNIYEKNVQKRDDYTFRLAITNHMAERPIYIRLLLDVLISLEKLRPRNE